MNFHLMGDQLGELTSTQYTHDMSETKRTQVQQHGRHEHKRSRLLFLGRVSAQATCTAILPPAVLSLLLRP